MGDTDSQSLWLQLEDMSLVSGEFPPPGDIAAPWHVRVMLGIAGWIGAGFILSPISIILGLLSALTGTSFVAGAIVTVAGAALIRTKPDNDFLTQLGLATSFAGQWLVLRSFTELSILEASTIAILTGIFEAVLFIAIANSVHRVWSAFVVAVAIVVALTDWKLEIYASVLLSAACAWLWLNEFKFAKYGTMMRDGGYGITLALIGTVGFIDVAGGLSLGGLDPERLTGFKYHIWVSDVLNAGVLLWATWQLLNRNASKSPSSFDWSIFAVIGVFALATLTVPGFAPAALILLLGFGNGNRVLTGLGVASSIGYLSFYYYSLETTLLNKSAIMAVTGIFLLVVRVAIKQWWSLRLHQGVDHA
jgi:hypothetical protein